MTSFVGVTWRWVVQDGLRWKIPFHLLDAIFYYSEGKMTVNFRVGTYRQPPADREGGPRRAVGQAERGGGAWLMLACLPGGGCGCGAGLEGGRDPAREDQAGAFERTTPGPGSSMAGRPEVDMMWLVIVGAGAGGRPPEEVGAEDAARGGAGQGLLQPGRRLSRLVAHTPHLAAPQSRESS